MAQAKQEWKAWVTNPPDCFFPENQEVDFYVLFPDFETLAQNCFNAMWSDKTCLKTGSPPIPHTPHSRTTSLKLYGLAKGMRMQSWVSEGPGFSTVWPNSSISASLFICKMGMKIEPIS